MKTAELKKLDRQALKKELESSLREHFNLRMQRATGQLSQTHRLKNARRQIAKIKTILNEKPE